MVTDKWLIGDLHCRVEYLEFFKGIFFEQDTCQQNMTKEDMWK